MTVELSPRNDEKQLDRTWFAFLPLMKEKIKSGLEDLSNPPLDPPFIREGSRSNRPFSGQTLRRDV
jgi:hypothetical protein